MSSRSNAAARETGELEWDLPQAFEAEQALLGTMLDDDSAVALALKIVQAEDFHREAHRRIFAAAQAVHERREPVDKITVGVQLRANGHYEDCGGIEYLDALRKQYATTSRGHVLTYAFCVREKSHLRAMIMAAGEIRAAAFADPEDVTRCVAEAVAKLRAIEQAALADDPDANLWTDMATVAEAAGGITWAWPNWLPNGYLTLIAGDVGVGKSKLALTIANAVTTGAPWPDGAEGSDEIGSAVYLDSEGATPLQALRAVAQSKNGAARIVTVSPDADKVLMLDDAKTLALVEDKCQKLGDVKLIVADSLRSGMTGDENSSEFGQKLAPWSHLAQRLKVPVVMLHHARKPADGQRTMTLERLRGSSAITALPRVVIGMDKPDEEDPNVRVTMLKNNFAPVQNPFGLALTEIGTEPAPTPRAPRPPTKENEAIGFLEEALAGGKRRASEVLEEAEAEGISGTTLHRAKKALGVVVMPDGEDGRVKWWALPEHG